MGKHVNGFSYLIVKYIFIILFLLAGKLYGFSHMPYPDGDVNVIIKNNKPCIYIDANGLTGSYMLRIGYIDENTGNSEYWRYLSSFEKQYPVKEKCIFADESNFPNINFRNNVSYSFTLKEASVPGDDRYLSNNFDGFSSTYCLKNTNGKFEVQDFDFSKNRCVDKVEILSSSNTKQQISWLDLLFRWFMDLWK